MRQTIQGAVIGALVATGVVLAAQTGIFDTVSVDSTAADAVDIAGGIVLGIDLSAEDGGVPERGIIFVNATTCPSPLVAFPLPFNSGGLLACLYAPSGSAVLGAALLGTARLQ